MKGQNPSSHQEPAGSDPPDWQMLADDIAVRGIAKYGDLGVSTLELASWIELVQGDGSLSVAALNTDLYFAAALAKGHPEAWALWHEELEAPVIRWMTKLAQGCRLGEEIMSELAGDLFAGKLKKYKGKAALKTWLCRVARNRLTDKLRTERRQIQAVSLSLWQEEGSAVASSLDKDNFHDEITERCYREVLTKVLKEELADLPEGEKLLIEQYFWEEARMRALANQYGVNRTQIGRRIKAIRYKLGCTLVAKGAVHIE